MWCARSRKHRFETYIVGGAVRDLLLGLRPKDFDVATNASPRKSKTCFAAPSSLASAFASCTSCIGRGREHEVIEVSTFRAFLDNSRQADK